MVMLIAKWSYEKIAIANNVLHRIWEGWRENPVVWRMLETEAGQDASQGAERYFTPGEPVGNYAPVLTPNIARHLEAL